MQLLFLFLCFLLSPTSAERIPGFVSLDCGHSCSNYTNYTDTVTGIPWEWDSSFGLEAVSSPANVDLPPSASLLVSNTQLKSLRYFPGNHTKYCYTFGDSTYNITSNATYLVRATFWAGNNIAKLPIELIPKNGDGILRFQLLINADVWTNVSIPIPQTEVVQTEVYVVALSSSLSVCLSGAGVQSVDSALGATFGTPFISSLEIRQIPIDAERIAPLHQVMRPTSAMTRAVYVVDRINYGSSTDMSVRYPNDAYDRIWRGDSTSSEEQRDNTTVLIAGLSSNNNVPLPVMQTAYAKDNSSVNASDFDVTIPILSGNRSIGSYACCLYFAEISNGVAGSGQRVFEYTIYTDDFNEQKGSSNGSIDLYSEAGKDAVFTRIDLFQLDDDDDNVVFRFKPNTTSQNVSAGPLLSALELYQISDQNASSGMHGGDAAAVRAVRDAFPSVLGWWSADPCLPYPYDWLRCGSSHRIVSLSLANKSLPGEIPDVIRNLTALQTLDLQGNNFCGTIPDFLENLQNLTTLDLEGNNLSGSIPEFLGTLPNLKTLNLKNNHFHGKIPSSLLNKVASQNFTLSVDEYLLEAPHPHSKLASIVGGSIGGAILLISVIGAFCLVRRYRKHKENVNANEDGNENARHRQVMTKARGSRKLLFRKRSNAEDANDIQLDVNQVRCFTYEDIENITDSFSRRLGKGGFGDVFHGRLSHGVEVAIKVSSENSRQGPQAFMNEVELLSRVHHRNLVKLIGYCKDTKLMLVYEYMPNGSLDKNLRENGPSNLRLTWRDRLKIAIGAADGLEYLHDGCTPPIIHRDVKSSNILLDATMDGKISDFGISRPIIGSKTDRTLTSVVGSRGYIPPDILNGNKINEKLDVYAFGVVLLELVTGKNPIFNDGYIEHHITEWVKSKVQGGELQTFMDPTIGHRYNPSSMWKVVDVALLCVSPDNHERPQMNEVTSELKNALALEIHENETSKFTTNINMTLLTR